MQFRNLSINDLDFALELTTIENWGTTRGELKDLLIFAPNCATLATINDNPVGMIFTVSYDNFGFIGNLIVKKEFRNQGLLIANPCGWKGKLSINQVIVYFK